MEFFLTSKGIKRKAVTLLAAVYEVVSAIPGTGEILNVLQLINGLLGGVALTHAGYGKTLSEEKIAGAVSAIYLLIFLSTFFPPLVPFLPVLYKAAGTLAVARVGKAVIE